MSLRLLLYNISACFVNHDRRLSDCANWQFLNHYNISPPPSSPDVETAVEGAGDIGRGSVHHGRPSPCPPFLSGPLQPRGRGPPEETCPSPQQGSPLHHTLYTTGRNLWLLGVHVLLANEAARQMQSGQVNYIQLHTSVSVLCVKDINRDRVRSNQKLTRHFLKPLCS